MVAFAQVALAAPGVTPTTYSNTGGPGTVFGPIEKVVETPAIAPLADVYFLADTTGSMAGPIGNVQANAADILSTIEAGATDPRFGAGDYKDFPFDAYAFNNAASLDPGTSAAAQTAISGWSAAGGVDGPEGQLYALHKIATDSAIGWRSGSSRFLVWFGDAPGHDPVCSAISGEAADITTSSVATELAAADITVIAISTPTGYPDGLNDNAATGGDYISACGSPAVVTGQANTITAATGGTHLVAASSDDVADLILDALQNLPVTVTFDASTCAPDLSVSMNPTSASGTSGDTFNFSETITVSSTATPGVKTCVVQFLVNGTAAPEFAQQVSITVPQPNQPPVCSTVTAGPNLWPPNHKLVPITLTGASDPDGDPITLTITGVTQDEPLNGLGDGDTSPDAVLTGGALQLRAERSGTGDGRVYRIAFTVADDEGASCTGVATVGVPHDQGKKKPPPVDSGLVVNSLAP
jgi:hypothetical protein